MANLFIVDFNPVQSLLFKGVHNLPNMAAAALFRGHQAVDQVRIFLHGTSVRPNDIVNEGYPDFGAGLGSELG
ncbi:hypothetical protein D1872_325270 [compost metagenome]